MCDFLLARGANPNFRIAETGETALHNTLTKAGRPHFLPVLLDAGADVHARTLTGASTGAFMRDVRTVGETTLHRAAANGDAAMIPLLLERGADKQAPDANGESPLSWGSRHLRPGAILALLAFGEHRIGPLHSERLASDHGVGFGSGIDRDLQEDYLPESGPEQG